MNVTRIPAYPKEKEGVCGLHLHMSLGSNPIPPATNSNLEVNAMWIWVNSLDRTKEVFSERNKTIPDHE
jgi:hypothetical protein